MLPDFALSGTMSDLPICPKCGYARSARDETPEWQCPACQVAYVKVAGGDHAPAIYPDAMAAESSFSGWWRWLGLLFLATLAVAGMVGHWDVRQPSRPLALPTTSREAVAPPRVPVLAPPPLAAPAPITPPDPTAGVWVPRRQRIQLFTEPEHALLDRQLAALLPQRPGKVDIYFIGIGAYFEQDVFLKEVHTVRRLFDSRFDTRTRSVVMANSPNRGIATPPASVEGLRRALIYVADLMDPEEDVVFLHLTSHGSASHELWFTYGGREGTHLTPAMLKGYLEEAQIPYRMISVSACYSGGFVAPLADERSLIVTSADRERNSFGCSSDSEITYFSEALFGSALQETYSFEEAFRRADQLILEKERRQGFRHSLPQIYVGEAIKEKLARIEYQLKRAATP